MNRQDDPNHDAPQTNKPPMRDREPGGESDLPTHIILFDNRGNLSRTFDRFKPLFDPARCWRTDSAADPWASRNVAEAVQTEAMAHRWAELVVPVSQTNGSPFFSLAAREVVYQVTIGLNARHEKGWKLRDFLNGLSCREEILKIARHNDASKVSIARVFADDRYSPSIVSTIVTHIHKFERMAALERAEPAGNPFSLEDFFTSPGILLVGSAPQFHQSMAPFNMLLLEALSDSVLRREEHTLGAYMFLLDDLPYELQAGSLERLIRAGPLKGADVYVNGARHPFPLRAAKSVANHSTEKF